MVLHLVLSVASINPSSARDASALKLLKAIAQYTPPPNHPPTPGNLADALQELRDARQPPQPRELDALSPLQRRAATDGELLDMSKLLDAMRPPAHAVFLDLGSGSADALLNIAATARMRGALGVELLGSRHADAVRALDKLQPELRTPVELVQADIANLAELLDGPSDDGASFGLRDVSHAFTCSVCFDDFLLRRICETLGDAELCPNFQLLVSMRALPSQQYLTPVGELRLETTWNAAASAYAYVPSDLLARPEQPVGALSYFLRSKDGACSLPSALALGPEWTVRLPRS